MGRERSGEGGPRPLRPPSPLPAPEQLRGLSGPSWRRTLIFPAAGSFWRSSVPTERYLQERETRGPLLPAVQASHCPGPLPATPLGSFCPAAGDRRRPRPLHSAADVGGWLWPRPFLPPPGRSPEGLILAPLGASPTPSPAFPESSSPRSFACSEPSGREARGPCVLLGY